MDKSVPPTPKSGPPPAKRVLIADDDEDTRVIVASVVSILGYTPILAAGGQEAIEIFERETPWQTKSLPLKKA